MTRRADTEELARRLPDFLRDVESGHEVLVTRGETVIARLIPMKNAKPARVLDLAPMEGKWLGERVLRSGDLMEEMLDDKRSPC